MTTNTQGSREEPDMPNDNGADSQAPRNQVPDLRWLFGAQVIIVATAIGLTRSGNARAA